MSQENELRKRAIKSIKAKRAFQLHLTIYLIFSIGFIVVDWYTSVGGLKWAWWPIMGWGIGVVFNWFAVYKMGYHNISEDEIVSEINRIR